MAESVRLVDGLIFPIDRLTSNVGGRTDKADTVVAIFGGRVRLGDIFRLVLGPVALGGTIGCDGT